MANRIEFFDLWKANYGGASVAIYKAGTTALASIFTDEALSVAAANPQTLLSLTKNGITFGKFANPLYTSVSYKMVVNSTDETGVIRPPLTSLAAQDASDATVRVTGGSQDRALDNMLAVPIDIEDHGVFLPVTNPSYSSSTNNATLTAAIGVAAAQGGGEVILPAGTFYVTTFSIPTGVLVRGQGRTSTVLQSNQASKIVTLSGDRAGFADLTLDGVSKVAGSTGVFGKAKNELRVNDALVKNFATGMQFQGGKRFDFEDLYIDGCTNGAKFHGDLDSSGDATGDVFKFNRWAGGRVTNCTGIGVEFAYVDKRCWHNALADIGFESNTGTALKVNGARYTDLYGCWWTGNVIDLHVLDGTDTTKNYENTVIGLHINGGEISAKMTFIGVCQDIVFNGVEFSAGTYTLTSPTNAILTMDCIEATAVTLAGTGQTKWVRARSGLGDHPGSAGVTTDATATVAWSYTLAPGERVNVEAVVLANGRNVIDYAMYHIARSAHRTGSTLAYDNQTANFTVGDTITGATSAVTARITADADAGATGTLTLRDISGEFQNNEIISGAIGGSAQVNGTLAHQNAALLGATTSVETAVESNAAFACDFSVSAYDVRIDVTGAAMTMEWTVSAKVVSG